MAIAAALAYADPADPQAVAMPETIAAEGLDKVLTEDCGLLPHEGLARAVKWQWLRLSRGQARDLAPGVGALPWTGAAVEDLYQCQGETRVVRSAAQGDPTVALV